MNQHFRSSWWGNAFEAHKPHDICLATNAKVWTQKYKIAFSCRSKVQTIFCISGNGLDQFALACRLAYSFYIFSNAYYLLLFHYHQHYAPYLMCIKLQNYSFRVVVQRIMIFWFCPVKYLNYKSDKQFKVCCLY